jgi:hypothetical protein
MRDFSSQNDLFILIFAYDVVFTDDSIGGFLGFITFRSSESAEISKKILMNKYA